MKQNRRKSKKIETGRVCVTLPRILLEDFREKSYLTGLSVSKLIYHRLRTRAPIVIVGKEVLEAVLELRALLKEAHAQGQMQPENFQTLRESLDFYERLIDFDANIETVGGRRKC